MATRKARDLRDMTSKELHVRLKELKDEYFHLRIKKALGQVEQTHRFPEIRREIARTITILKQKEMAEAGGEKE